MSTLYWTYELISWMLGIVSTGHLHVAYVCVCVHIFVKPMLNIFLYFSPLSISETGSFTESRVHEFRKTSLPVSPRYPLVHASLTWSFNHTSQLEKWKAPKLHPLFALESGD